MFGIPLPLIAALPLRDETRYLVDDTTVGLVVLVGAILVFTLLLLSRRPRFVDPATAPHFHGRPKATSVTKTHV